MLSLFRTITRLPKRYGRYCSCYCPTEPFDPGIQVSYLPNGVRVMTEENYSPLACVSLFIVAGSRYETANSNGLTHFIEHLAFKGCRTMNKLQFEDKVLRMGAKFKAKTRREMQIFSVLLPSNLATEGMCLLFKIVNELSLEECDIEREAYNLCLETMDADNKPKAVVFDYLHAAAFQGTPLAQPVIGPLRNRANFNRDAILNFFCQNYTTCRLILATSGNVSHDTALRTVLPTFGALPAGPLWDVDDGYCRFTGSEVVYRNDSLPFAHVAIAFEAPGFTSPDYWAMFVASCLIGSWDATQGRFENQPFQVAQGAGDCRCKSYESFYIAYKDVGLWGIYFVGDGRNLDDMVFNIQDAWMKMCHTLPQIKLTRALNMAKMKLARRYDGVVNSCRDMGNQMMYACRRKSLNEVLHLADMVLPYKIMELGQRYLVNQSPAVAAVGPTETLPEYNRTLQGMYWLRW